MTKVFLFLNLMDDQLEVKNKTSLFKKFGIPTICKKSLGRFYFDILNYVHKNFHEITLKKLDLPSESIVANWMTFYKFTLIKNDVFPGLNIVGFKLLLHHAREQYKSMKGFYTGSNFNLEFYKVLI